MCFFAEQFHIIHTLKQLFFGVVKCFLIFRPDEEPDNELSPIVCSDMVLVGYAPYLISLG